MLRLDCEVEAESTDSLIMIYQMNMGWIVESFFDPITVLWRAIIVKCRPIGPEAGYGIVCSVPYDTGVL